MSPIWDTTSAHKRSKCSAAHSKETPRKITLWVPRPEHLAPRMD